MERERLIDEILDETLRLRPARSAAQGPDDQRHPDQRPAQDLRRAPRQAGKDRRQVPRQRPPAADHRPHRVQGRPARRRNVARWSTPVCRTARRVNAIIPPLALDGPTVSHPPLRRQPAQARRPAQLQGLHARDGDAHGGVHQGPAEHRSSPAAPVAARRRCSTRCRASSRTTSGSITIEDAAELQLQQDHVVRLETRPPNIEGKGAVTTRDLVRNALRMRPERIIIGECRGGESLDMLQAMNTGHDGSMTTLHANNPREALSPAGNHDHDGRLRNADQGDAAADRLGRRPDHPGQPPPGRAAQDHEHHGSA